MLRDTPDPKNLPARFIDGFIRDAKAAGVSNVQTFTQKSAAYQAGRASALSRLGFTTRGRP